MENNSFKAFVINLDRNPERLAFMKNQLDLLSISFERFKAVDGKTFDFTGICDGVLFKKNNNGETMTKGEKGCALSHKMVLESFLASKEPYALVIEDDVELDQNFDKILQQELRKRKEKRTNWEYLSFNYPATGWKNIVLWLYLFSNMMLDNKTKLSYWIKLPLYVIKFVAVVFISLLEGLRELLYKKLYRYGKASYFFRPLYLAGCYLVTREGAKKLVELNRGLKYTADGLPQVARIKKNLRFMAFVPRTARQKREVFKSELNEKLTSTTIISY